MLSLHCIIKKIKKLNKECRKIKSIENIDIYELTPSSNITDDTYFNYLKAAIDKKTITNIALSGPYGSGKSSILKNFVDNMNANYKFLNISLATFENKKKDDSLSGDELKKFNDEQYNQIEKSILQQMFYSVEQSEIPNSRFKRIKFDKNLSRNSIFFTIWVVSIIELFSPYTFIYHYLGYFDLELILSIIFGLGLIKFGRMIYAATSNIKLSKFIIQNQEVSFDNDAQTSILNANIDEILYFFNTTNYNVMIIEDLDRFDNTEIFIKLREINTLLNNRKDKEKITFIYAIRDDMFKDKDRTKFFDYIIPVVPFINSSNSFKKLRDLFIKENLIIEPEPNENNISLINEKFIKDISVYINDMRFLINVFNEFIQYTHKLSEDIKLDYNCLFAISLYKNYKPDDFAKLHNNEGILHTIFSQKYKNLILSDITKNLENEIVELTKRIDVSNSISVQNIEELRSLYIYHLMSETKQIITHFNINSNYVSLNDFIKNHFDEYFEAKEKNITFRSYAHNPYNAEKTFSQLEKLVDKNYSYEEKKAAIESKNTILLDGLKKQRENKQKELSKLKTKTISELLNINEIEDELIINKQLFNKCLDEKVTDDDKKIDILKDDLLMYLLRYGYIKEDYFKYISYYYPGQETPNDINFILNIQNNRNEYSYDFELTHFEYILNELNSENHFSKEAILNYLLVHTLLNKKEFVNKFKILDSNETSNYSDIAIKNIIKFILSNIDKYFNFMDTYIDTYNDNSILAYIDWWKVNLWEYIISNNDFSVEKKDKYFYIIFDINEKNKALNLLEIIDKYNQLSQYIINKTTFNDFVNKISDFNSFIEFLKSKGLTFKKLDDIDHNSENFNLIYENELYRINFEWISKILHSCSEDDLKLKNYSSILSSGKEKLIKY